MQINHCPPLLFRFGHQTAQARTRYSAHSLPHDLVFVPLQVAAQTDSSVLDALWTRAAAATLNAARVPVAPAVQRRCWAARFAR